MNVKFELYKVELKKVLSKKAIWIALIIGLIFVLLVGLTNLSADGHSARVKLQEEKLLELSGQKIDDKFLENYHNTIEQELEDNWDEYEKLYEYDPGKAYKEASNSIGMNALYELIYTVVRDREKVATVTETEFYDAMREDIIKDGRELGAKEGDVEKWLVEYDEIDKPITYSYAWAYQNLLDVLFLMGWILTLCIAISLSGMFADEKTNRTDVMILSSKNGRMPILLAKFFAGITVSILEVLILMGSSFLVMFVIYGASGWEGQIQNICMSSPWNITIGKMMLIYIALAIITSIFFAVTNMLVSHLTKSAVITLAIHAAIVFAGLFNVPSSLGLFSKLWQLRPTMVLYYGSFVNTHMYGPFNNIEATMLVYSLVSIVLAIILAFSYNKSQVESR